MTDNLGWPGGLAVHEDRLFWSDVMLMTVESARLDGSERAPVLHRLREQPAGVAILNGHVYWGYRGLTGALHRVPLPKGPPSPALNVTEDSVIRPGLPWLLDIKAIDVSTVNTPCLKVRLPRRWSCSSPHSLPLPAARRPLLSATRGGQRY